MTVPSLPSSPTLTKVKSRQLNLNFRELMTQIDVQVIDTERRDNQAWEEALVLERRLRKELDVSDSESSEQEDPTKNTKRKTPKANEPNPVSRETSTKPEVKNKPLESITLQQSTPTPQPTSEIVVTSTNLPRTNFRNPSESDIELTTRTSQNTKISPITTNPNSSVNKPETKVTLKPSGQTVSYTETTTPTKPWTNSTISSTLSSTSEVIPLKSSHNTQPTFKVPYKVISSGTTQGSETPTSTKSSLVTKETNLEVPSKPLEQVSPSKPPPLIDNLTVHPSQPGSNLDNVNKNSVETTVNNPTPTTGSKIYIDSTPLSTIDNHKDSSKKLDRGPLNPPTNIESTTSKKPDTIITKEQVSNSITSVSVPVPPSETNLTSQTKSTNLKPKPLVRENSFVVPDSSIQLPMARYCNPRGKPIVGTTPMIQITPCDGIEVGRNSDLSQQLGLSSKFRLDLRSQDISSHGLSSLPISSEGDSHIIPFNMMSTPVKVSKQAPSASPLTPRRLAIPMPNSPIKESSLNPQTWLENDYPSELKTWISSSGTDGQPREFGMDHDSNPFLARATSTPRLAQRLKKASDHPKLPSGPTELRPKLPDIEFQDISLDLTLLERKGLTSPGHNIKMPTDVECFEKDWQRLAFNIDDSPDKSGRASRQARRSHVSCAFPQDLSLGFTSQLELKDKSSSKVVPTGVPDDVLETGAAMDNNSDNESAKTLTPSFLRSQHDIDISDLKPSSPLRELQQRRAQELAQKTEIDKKSEHLSPEKSQDYDGSYVVGSVLDDGFSADGSIIHTNTIPQWARPGDVLDQKIIAMQATDLNDYFGGFRPANLKELFATRSLSLMSTPPPAPVIFPYTQMDSPFYAVNEFMVKPTPTPKTSLAMRRLFSSSSSARHTSSSLTAVSTPPAKSTLTHSTKTFTKSSFKLPNKDPLNPSAPTQPPPRTKVLPRPQIRAPTRLPTKLPPTTTNPTKVTRRWDEPTTTNVRRRV